MNSILIQPWWNLIKNRKMILMSTTSTIFCFNQIIFFRFYRLAKLLKFAQSVFNALRNQFEIFGLGVYVFAQDIRILAFFWKETLFYFLEISCLIFYPFSVNPIYWSAYVTNWPSFWRIHSVILNDLHTLFGNQENFLHTFLRDLLTESDKWSI